MSSYRGGETTGFQSPAQDYIEDVVNLSDLLDLRKPSRYPVRVLGQALKERGIDDGDILVVDASEEPIPGKVCVAMIGGDVILATLKRVGSDWYLHASTGAVLEVTGEIEVWAIVTALVRSPV